MKHKSNRGLVNIPEDDPIRNEIQEIHVRKGSFIIWDSRIPHGNFPNNNDQFRIVQYITFEPAKEDNQREVKERIEAFRLRSSNSKINEFFQEFPYPELTELGEKILGLRNWKTNEIVQI